MKLYRRICGYATSAVKQDVQYQIPIAVRSLKSNPIDHNQNDVSKFYTIEPKTVSKIFQSGGLPKPFVEQTQVFAETALMIRKPALEVINNLKIANYEKPAVRYLMYGKTGSGKSLSLAHILHYAHTAKFILFHIPYVPIWLKYDRKEVTWSSTKEGFADIPLVAAQWLKHFLHQNETILQELNLTTSKEYTWSIRETTPPGSTLKDLITHGINRAKYACDIMDILLNELKMHCTNNKCKMIVAIDGFNAFFNEKTDLKTEDRVKVKPQQITMVQTGLSAVKSDWNNGAIVMITSPRASLNTRRESHLPIYLIGREGFQLIDPFIPIMVPELDKIEFNNMLDYYEEKRWLQKPGGRQELEFLSSRLPAELMIRCAPL
ncbi:28S ribosomal protein S29, mitochondrial [Daktulosphaira vitifoliae]|uniref:28S ribosomal protein S29, mitochondrial n=1 Tax=Daktulosphaira vitifoliae TaxID=58002 RepID=UPI0021A9C975|nr:28S ribosomal protein S29, mitochondrial [Daktulosphaira vitifoliae]